MLGSRISWYRCSGRFTAPKYGDLAKRTKALSNISSSRYQPSEILTLKSEKIRLILEVEKYLHIYTRNWEMSHPHVNYSDSRGHVKYSDSSELWSFEAVILGRRSQYDE
jgi:hypothetical protein